MWGTILCKHGSMEGDIRERTLKGRHVMGALERVMKGIKVSMVVKTGIRNSVILPTLSYASEIWTWNAAQQSRIRAVEMSYMRGACGVSRWDRESNEDMYRRFGMSETAVGMDCGVVEWVKRSTLRWYGHVKRMNECDFTRRVFESTVEVGVGMVRVVGVRDGAACEGVVEVMGADGVPASRPHDRPRQEGGNDRVVVHHEADGRQDGAGEAFLTRE